MAVILYMFALLLCSLPLSFDSRPTSAKVMQTSVENINNFFGNNYFKIFKRHLGKVGKCADGKKWILGLCRSPNFDSEESHKDAGYELPTDDEPNTIKSTGKFVTITKSAPDSDLVPTDTTTEPALDVVPLPKPTATGVITDEPAVNDVVPTVNTTTTTYYVSDTKVATDDVGTKTTIEPTDSVLSTADVLTTMKVVSTTEPESIGAASSDVLPEKQAQTTNSVPTNIVPNTEVVTNSEEESISHIVLGTKSGTLHDENQGNEHSTASPGTNENYSGLTAVQVILIALCIIALFIIALCMIALALAYEKLLRPYVSKLRLESPSEQRNEDENDIDDVMVIPLLTKQ